MGVLGDRQFGLQAVMRNEAGDGEMEGSGYFFRFAQAVVAIFFQQDEAKGDKHAKDDADGGADDRS